MNSNTDKDGAEGAEVSAKLGAGGGQALRVSLWVLGGVAGLQLLGAAWALVPRLRLEPLELPGKTVKREKVVRPAAVVVAPQPVVNERSVEVVPETFTSLPPLTFEDPAALKDTMAAEMVRQGNQLRSAGDARGALERYNEALMRVPGHPRVLSEVAMTYDAMGMAVKGVESWQAIYELGKENAGELYFLAEMKLRGRDLVAESAVDVETGLLPEQILSVADVREVKDPDRSAGETVRLEIVLRGMPGVEIDAELFEAHVLFFDLVNGSMIEQTTADAPVSRWASEAPIDWAGGDTETLEVTYYHPPMTSAELSALGTREYYGYVVRVFYGGELTDAIASSQALMAMAQTEAGDREVAPPSLDPGLFPVFPQ